MLVILPQVVRARTLTWCSRVICVMALICAPLGTARAQTPRTKPAPARPTPARKAPTADELFKQGVQFEEHAQPKEALAAFVQAVKLDPTNAVYQSRLGGAYAALEDWEHAAVAYRQAVGLGGAPADLEMLGRVLVRRGAFSDAVESFEKAIAGGRRSAATLLAYAEALAGAGRASDAGRQAEAAVMLEPADTAIRARRDRIVAALPPSARPKHGLRDADYATGIALGSWERAPGIKSWDDACTDDSQVTACWLAGLSYGILEHAGRRFLRKACDLGHAEACNDLGDRYRFGMLQDGIVGQYEDGYAEQFLRFGPGPEEPVRDLGLAAKAYGKACDGGSRDGCLSLAFLLEWGRGVAADPARARLLLTDLCEGGQLFACVERDHPLPRPQVNPPAGLTGGACTSMEACSAACSVRALAECERIRYFKFEWARVHAPHVPPGLKGREQNDAAKKYDAGANTLFGLVAPACAAGLDWACTALTYHNQPQAMNAGCAAGSGVACLVLQGMTEPTCARGVDSCDRLRARVCQLGLNQCDVSDGDAMRVLAYCEMGVARACARFVVEMAKDPSAEATLGRFTRDHVARMACNGGRGCARFAPGLPASLSYAHALMDCNEGSAGNDPNFGVNYEIACRDAGAALLRTVAPAAEEARYTTTVLQLWKAYAVDWERFPRQLAQYGCDRKNAYACFAMSQLWTNVRWLTDSLPVVQVGNEPVFTGSSACLSDPTGRCREAEQFRFREEHEQWERDRAKYAQRGSTISTQDPRAKVAAERFLHLACDAGQRLLWGRCP